MTDRGLRSASTRRLGIVLVALCLLAASCGTRRTHDELLLAQADLPAGVTAGSGSTPGTPTDGSGPVTTLAGSPTGSDGPGTATPTGGGGDGGGATNATTPGGGSGPSVANGSLVRIAIVGTLSGPAGEVFSTMADGAQLWVRSVNDRGGLNGHPVELLVGDDGGDPARHQALVQEYVEQRGVIAFMANPEALTGSGSVDYLTAHGVPVVGSETANDYFYSSPAYFPQGASGKALLQAGTAINIQYMLQAGQTRFGIIACSEVQTCRDAANTDAAPYNEAGIEVVYRAQVSLAQPDFTAECLNAQRAEVQVLTVALPANAVRNVARSCARQGFHPVIQIPAGAAIDDFRTDPNLDGMRIFGSVQSWAVGNTPLTAEFQDAVDRYTGEVPNSGQMLAWVAGKIIELGAVALPEPATSHDLLNGLWGLHGDLLPELTGPLLFSPNQPAGRSACQFATVIQGGQFVPGNGGERSCVEYDPNA